MKDLEIQWITTKSEEQEGLVKNMIQFIMTHKIDTIAFMADYGKGFTINSYDNYDWFEVTEFVPFENHALDGID